VCGIVGYIGEREALPILVDSLKRLEYRGYDSCGLALLGSKMRVFKDKGRIGELEMSLLPVSAKLGIGHTRWATHGEPSKANAHPHLDCSGRLAVVHNGVITNFQKLKERLLSQGHIFASETDSEVIPHLISSYYHGDLLQAMGRALEEIEGSYAIATICHGHDGIIVARNESPLVIGIGDREFFVASDVAGILGRAQWVIYLEDGDIGFLSREGVRIFHHGVPAERKEQRVSWTIEQAQKAGYEHFMLKEIHEQPKMLAEIVGKYVRTVESKVDLGLAKDMDFTNILLLACGTSYHAALAGEHVLEKLAYIPVRAAVSSEFNCSDAVVDRTLAVAITQSGETADTVRALRKAKGKGCHTLAITNVMGSSVTRVADETFYLMAGPEISVAATKSFTAQLIALYLLALSWGRIALPFQRKLTDELKKLPGKVARVLAEEGEIADYGRYVAMYDNVFFIGRGLNLPVALEGALKLKEISYIHAEGYPAGELKHGPLALLTPALPVIAVVTSDNTYDITLANIKEIKARGASVIALASEDDTESEKYADSVIRAPEVDPLLSPVVNTVVLQLLAYYAARERGCPIDMPRNLAKSVTVE
jgi:glucosamine--fructose-6-phosphate aminotransferase (isomerizing)